MKKLLGSTLALAMLFAYGQANAELLKNFKLGGQIDLQATAARNVTDFITRGAGNNDRIGDAQTRVMLGMDWDLLDDVHSKVSLTKNNRTYTGASENLDAITLNTMIDQAYFKVDKVMGAVDATFGRQFYGTSGDMVAYFGPSDKALYGLPVTALDAGRFDWKNEHMNVTGVVGKTVGTGLGVAGVNRDLRGLTAMCTKHENMHLGAYLYNMVTHGVGAVGTPAGTNDNLYLAGLKAKVMMGGGWGNAEFAKNFGENRLAGGLPLAHVANYSGWAFKANAGYKADLANLGAVTPWGELGYGSGDGDNIDNKNEAFTAISPDYRPGSIYGRFAVAAGGASVGSGLGAGNPAMASNSLSNRAIWGLGVKTTPAAVSKLTAGLSYWDYHFQRKPMAVSTTANTEVATGNKHMGSEVDLDLTWTHSENVSFGAGWGTFQPGGYVKNLRAAAGGTNPVEMYYMDARLKF